MRTAIAVSSLIYGLALAGPVEKRQSFDLDAYEAVVTASATGAPVGDAVPQISVTSTYDPTSVASVVVAQVTSLAPESATDTQAQVVTVAKRDVVCTTRTFNGPQVTTPADTPDAFTSYQPFSDAANNAAEVENIPAGYAVVPGFVNLLGTAQDSSYKTYVSSKLSSYDPAQCAALCDAMSGCNAFNIYFERVPLVVSSTTQVPDSNVCPASATSASATLIKCAFYGMPIRASSATFVYQFQGKFKVVHAGSNAYVKSSAPSLDGYEGPVSFGNATINAPAPVIDHGYLRSQTFGTNVPYDPSLCAASCQAQTDYNAKHGTFGGAPCVFFDAYVFYKNGQNGVLTCAYYSTPYGTAYAKNVGQYDGSGNHYTPGSSFGYYVDGYYVE